MRTALLKIYKESPHFPTTSAPIPYLLQISSQTSRDACHLFTEKTEADSGLTNGADLGIIHIADALGFDWFTATGPKVLKI